ncbi:reverse transcriptase [Tanacetum coccineum]
MANRLKPHLHKIVSPQQSAFILGRLIQDSIVIANEAFHYIRNKKKGSQQFMALKLDQSKAFDRVEWDFFLESLKRLGFGNKWYTWISACISSYELEFMINGSSIGTIKLSRGIRQGDTFFIIVADVLSKMINNALNNSLLSGMKMARECPVISHIFFAGDSLFFLKASIHECSKLISILDKYYVASGQSINFSKSAAIFSPNTSQELQLDLCRCLKVTIMDTKGTYLGLPTIHGRNKNELLSYILDRVLKKMQGWKQKFLSHAGRTILIKLVIQSIPSYAMQCYILPAGFLNKLMSHVKHFFWGGDAHEKHIHWIKWERLSRPKKEDGAWNMSKLKAHISDEEANFIAEIPISRTHTNDRIIRHCDTKGNYTVKSGYRQALKWCNLMKLPHLHHFLILNFGKRENLYKRNCSSSPLCQICNSQVETIEHVFFECPWTKSVWFGSNYGLRADNLSGKFASVSSLSTTPLSSLVHSHSSQESSPKWVPPTSNVVKLNCDGAFKLNQGAVGIVARDSEGAILAVSGERCHASSALAMELLAIRNAYNLALTNGWVGAIIESDSSDAINLSSSECVPPWALGVIVADIREWASRLNLQFSWVRRTCNRVAHHVAGIAQKSVANFLWNVNFPTELTSLMRSDLQ